MKAQLELVDKGKYHGALVRTRVEKVLLGEAPKKRALCSEKKYAQINAIEEIQSEIVLYNDQASIKRCFRTFYDKQFARHAIDVVAFKDEFMNILPCLDKQITSLLETDITEN